MERHSQFNSSSRATYNSRSNSRAGVSIMNTSKFNLSRGSKSYLGSKSNLYSGSQKGLLSTSKATIVPGALIYKDGVDVTPKPLIQPEPTTKKHQNEGGNFGGAGFMQPIRSMFAGSVMDTSITGGPNASIMNASMMGSVTDEFHSIGGSSRLQSREGIKLTQDEESHQELTQLDLEQHVSINLSETDTIWLLDIPSTWVANDSEEAESVREQNKLYAELCKTRPGNDRYSERGMQTFNQTLKSKIIQTENVGMMDAEVYASEWDMYDIMHDEVQRSSSLEDDIDREISSIGASRCSTAETKSRALTAMSTTAYSTAASSMFAASVNPEMTTYGANSIAGPISFIPSATKTEDEAPKFDPTKPNDHPILQMESLKNNLRIMERAVTQNLFQMKQAMYRELPLVIDPDRESPRDTFTLKTLHLEKLWDFSCHLTKERKVTCIAWNPHNKDIVAVGYGEFYAVEHTPGLICCWSIKNPTHPERIFYAQCGVTSLSFSQYHPNLLAAGLYNGMLALYNCRCTSHEPVFTSRDALFKHSGPVWQANWVVKERSFGENKAEVLVSISVDGRILQWTIRKGFESIQLMRLKRMFQPRSIENKMSTTKLKPSQSIHKKKSKQKIQQQKSEVVNSEALISQHAPGLGFSFSHQDSNIYLACTEEGYIHKCSCSYNEQFLETYTGHTGPVYKVLWHPQHKDIFLSCSSDWSLKLWNQDMQKPLHTFQVTKTNETVTSADKPSDLSSQAAVQDLDWSPHDPTVFACVRGGRFEIWNMRLSILDPALVQKGAPGTCQTCVKFSHNSNVILVGNSKGEVSVYLPQHAPATPKNRAQVLQDVLNSLETSKP